MDPAASEYPAALRRCFGEGWPGPVTAWGELQLLEGALLGFFCSERVEGTRRVATLKHLQRRYEDDAIDLGKLDGAWLPRVPVVLRGDTDELAGTPWRAGAGAHSDSADNVHLVDSALRPCRRAFGNITDGIMQPALGAKPGFHHGSRR